MSARGRKAKGKDRNVAADATTNEQDEDDLTQGIHYPNPKGRRGDAVQRRMRAAEERKEKREERLKEKERLAEEGGKGKGKKKKGRRRSDSLDDEPGQEGEPEKGKGGVTSRGRSTKDNKDVQANGHLDEDHAPHLHQHQYQKKSEPLRRLKGSIESVPNDTSSTESTSLRRNPRFRKAVEMTSSSDGRTRLRLQQDGDPAYSTATTSSIPPLLASLPSEVWVYLLGYLNNTERLALSNTCKGWRYFVLELRQHHKVGKKWNHSKAIIEQLQFLNNFCPRLRSLDLSASDRFGGEDEGEFRYLPTCLQVLDLTGCSVYDEHLPLLPKGLRALSLSRCWVTAAGLNQLPETLVCLDVSECLDIAIEPPPRPKTETDEADDEGCRSSDEDWAGQLFGYCSEEDTSETVSVASSIERQLRENDSGSEGSEIEMGGEEDEAEVIETETATSEQKKSADEGKEIAAGSSTSGTIPIEGLSFLSAAVAMSPLALGPNSWGDRISLMASNSNSLPTDETNDSLRNDEVEVDGDSASSLLTPRVVVDECPIDFRRFLNLTNLSLAGCINVRRLPPLPDTLDILNISKLPITGTLEGLPTRIATLSIAGCMLLDGEEVIPTLPHSITSLDVSGTALRAELLRRLPNLVSLTATDSRLVNLADLPTTLTSLNLSSSRLAAEELGQLPQSLKTLKLAYCHQLEDPAVSSLPRSLTRLNLKFCRKLTHEGINALPRNIKHLSLALIHQLDDEAIKCLPPKLESLSLVGVERVTDAGLKLLPKTLTSLTLTLRPANLSKAALKRLPTKIQVVYRETKRRRGLESSSGRKFLGQSSSGM